ncbi:MAG: DUF1206 domain-containing protein [Thermoleophilia bacterium]
MLGRPGRTQRAIGAVRPRGVDGGGWYAWLARAGLVAKGVSYGLVGVLAIQLALGEGGDATSREGALATLADGTPGRLVLGLLAVGFASYAAWRVVQAVVEREDGDGADAAAKEWGKRAGHLARAAIYAALTYSTVRILVDGRGESSGEGGGQEQRATAEVLGWPGGPWLVGIVGACVVGYAGWNAYRGLARKFEEKWESGRSRTARRWGSLAGVVGHLARAVVFALIGVFLVRAAIQYDPAEAIGLDGVLQELAGAAYGPYLLGLTAAGLVAYGVYCLVDARYRDVSTGRGSRARR